MTPEKADRFVKLMELSTSANDHEALLALRQATRMLQEDGSTWTTLLPASRLRTPAEIFQDLREELDRRRKEELERRAQAARPHFTGRRSRRL